MDNNHKDHKLHFINFNNNNASPAKLHKSRMDQQIFQRAIEKRKDAN